MKVKSIVISFLFLFTLHTQYAQCVKGITTNPDAPVNTERPDKRNTFFDWRALIYNVNSQYITTSQIESPFNQSNNLRVNHFLNNQDRLPQDGWELIKYDLGFNEDGTPKTTPVGYIHLVLYNKFTGVMRVFVAGDRPQAFTGASIEIGYSSGKMSSALSNSSKLFALDVFEANPSITSVSEYNNNNGKWFYADFQIGYDPCTCIYESEMKIQIRLINESEIDLSGSITGELTNITSGSGGVLENSYSFDKKDIINVAKKAQKTYKDVSKFVSDQEKALSMEGKTDAELTEVQRNKRHSLNSFQELIKKTTFLKDGLKTASYIGVAVDLINFFVGGGKKSASPQEVKIMPMALNAGINLKGTLTATYLYGDIIFYTPGSLNAQFNNPVNYPYYNEVLGVFNLLETPKAYSSVLESYYYDQGAYYEERFKIAYQLAPLKYVINPASGLRAENAEILASIDFGDLKTPYMPLSAITSFSIEAGEYIYDYGNGTSGYNILGCTAPASQMSISLLINLERGDADANTQNVLIALKYPVNMTSQSLPTYNPSYCDYANEEILIDQPQTINYDVQAWNKVTIGPNVSFTGTRTVMADNIVVLPGAVIPPNVTLKTGLPNGHVPAYVPPATQTEVQTFCNGSIYNSALRNLRQRPVDERQAETVAEYQPLTVYPNPANGTVTIQYFLETESLVSLKIFDITGREIASPLQEIQGPGLHEVKQDVSTVAPGIYFYNCQTEYRTETKRIMIIR